MKKVIKRLALSIISVAMLFGIALEAGAENAHFTFTNIETDQPDLYITKSASSAVDGYDYPSDTEFTFVLKWDQDRDGDLEFAENEMYYIYNEDGSQYTENGSEIFRTSSTGRFSLKAGQYAKFEWAGTVDYEITELEQNGWTQVVPAGGASAVGTVEATGTIVNFENVYVPRTSSTTESTNIEIRKDISWPSGYQTPDLSDITFTFYVEIDGKPYTNERYDLYELDGRTEVDSGLTDMSGYFSMAGDQIAVFPDIETGIDYKIIESATDGWKAVGETEYHGSTSSPLVYGYFANETSGLIVKKALGNDTEETDAAFAFIITDANGNSASNLRYYLYDAEGNVSEALYTDADGKFALKADETAVFIGLSVGDTFTVSEIVPDGYEVDQENASSTIAEGKYDTLTFTNSALSSFGFELKKLNDLGDILDGAEFTLSNASGTIKFNQDGDTYTADENGADTILSAGDIMINGLEEGSYTLTESTAPANYQGMEDSVTITINGNGTILISDNDNCDMVMQDSKYVISIANRELTDITATKIWDDSNDQDGRRPASISLQLYADNEEYGSSCDVSGTSNTWTYTWNNLPKYSDDGSEIIYTVKETIDESLGYTASYDDLTITNSYTPETVSISGTKTWDDANNQDGIRPESITVRLLADNVEIQSKTVTLNDAWEWTFDDLPKYSNGKEITYTVSEDAVEGYATTAGNGDYDFINFYEPGKTQISVRKVWNDSDDQDGVRPSEITVELLKNESETGTTAVLNDKNSWSYTFDDLDEYENGIRINWSVSEASCDPYDSVLSGDSQEGYLITNTYMPAEISVSGEKIWDDGDNRYGIRPDEITVRLYNGDVEIAQQTVKEDDGWTFEFTNLPKYENHGAEIQYTVKEDSVSGYTTDIKKNDDYTWTVTNMLNAEPQLSKEIAEDDYENKEDSEWGSKDDADNNQEVTFRLTMTEIRNAVNLTAHDYLENGLDFESGTLSVDLYDNGNYIKTLEPGTDYSLSETDCTDPNGCLMDGCTFEIQFNDSVFQDLSYDAYAVITYQAMTNTHASDYTDYEDDIKNYAYLTYGTESARSKPVEAETDIFGFGIYKYYVNGDGEDEALSDAKFILKCRDSYATFVEEDGCYILSGWTDDADNAGLLVSGSDGMIRIEGLDDDTYTLTETEAPFDFYELTGDITVTITNDGSVTFDGSDASAHTGYAKEMQVQNTPIHKNTVEVIKQDSDGKLLSDAEFALYKKYNDEWFECNTGTSDENGEIVFTNLYDGTYKLVETKAPKGYLLNTDEIEFELPNNEQTDDVYMIEVENAKAKGLINTGGMGTTVFMVFGLILIITGTGIILVSRKRRI